MAADMETLQKQLLEALEGKQREKEARLTAEEREKKMEEEQKIIRENLEGELRNVKEKLEQEKQKSERKESEKLEEEVKAREDRERELERKLEQKNTQIRILSSGYLDEGSMKWEAEMKKIGDAPIFSPYTTIGDLSFRIGCKNECPEKYFVIYLCCNDNGASKTHYALVEFTLRLPSAVDPWGKSFSCLFHADATNHEGLQCFWPNALKPSMGHIKNGHFTFIAEIKVIYHHKNAAADSVVDFSSPDPQLSDVILLVGGKRIHANRMYLAHYCKYFKATFCSDFAEKDKKEIQFGEIDASEFEEMLGVIYPQRKKVSTATVTGLLRMADFFDVPVLTRKCTSFLKKSTDFSLIAKLLLTEEFRLPELQYHLLDGFKTANDTKALINSADFGKFSLILRNTILQKHFQLSG